MRLNDMSKLRKLCHVTKHVHLKWYGGVLENYTGSWIQIVRILKSTHAILPN
jgi:hypothetical protein